MNLVICCMFLTIDLLLDGITSSSHMTLTLIEDEGGYGIELNLSGASQKIRVMQNDKAVFSLSEAQSLMLEISDLRHHLYRRKDRATDPSTMTVPLV